MVAMKKLQPKNYHRAKIHGVISVFKFQDTKRFSNRADDSVTFKLQVFDKKKYARTLLIARPFILMVTIYRYISSCLF